MEPLVEVCLQLLIVTLDHDMTLNSAAAPVYDETAMSDNLFINYLSRIHREEDFQFVLKGITRLLNNPLVQSYLPNSTKRLHCHQELLVFFWKICDYNKKFLYFVLKSSDVLDILVPILYHLNDSRADQCEYTSIVSDIGEDTRIQIPSSYFPYSSRGFNSHRRVHPALVEWRTQLWRAFKQTIHSHCPHGHSSV